MFDTFMATFLITQNWGVQDGRCATMASLPCLPARFPVGTKYVIEGRGLFVQRYIEFPNGRRVQLARRKALSCSCAALQQISIIPNETAAVIDAPSLGKRVVA
jgi:hypothetical protein